MTTELRCEELFRACDPRDIPFESTTAEPEPMEILGLRSIVDLLHEADHCANSAGRTTTAAEDVQAAIDAQLHRAGRIRERMLEAIRRKTVPIDTSGGTVGQINGLSVIDLGGHAFGHPTRITARARIGDGKVIDIEREIELGGPIHSKGVLILSGLLGARYAQRCHCRPRSASSSRTAASKATAPRSPSCARCCRRSPRSRSPCAARTSTCTTAGA